MDDGKFSQQEVIAMWPDEWMIVKHALIDLMCSGEWHTWALASLRVLIGG